VSNHLLVYVKDANSNPIPDLPLTLMNFSAVSGSTDMNGIAIFDVLPHTNGYIYFYNPNVDGYAVKRFTIGDEGFIKKIEIVYQTSKSIVPEQIVLNRNFLAGAICTICSIPIMLGDRFAEISGKLTHYDCYLSHIKSIYQKKLRTALERAFRKNFKDYLRSTEQKPRSTIDFIDTYVKDLGFVTKKDYKGSYSTTRMEIWDSLVNRPNNKEYSKEVNFDLVGILHTGSPNPSLTFIIELSINDLEKYIEKLKLLKSVDYKLIISDRTFVTDHIIVTTIDEFNDKMEKIIQMEIGLKGVCG